MTISGAWYKKDLEKDQRWQKVLSDKEKSALVAALKLVKEKNLSDIQQKDFPLNNFASLFDQLFRELTEGYGIALIKEFPCLTMGLSLDDIRKIFWGFCIHLGTPISQDNKGLLLYEIGGPEATKPQGKDYQGSYGRALKLHTDPGDIICMLGIQVAGKGGDSTLSSTTSIYNEISQTHPDLLKILCQPFYSDRVTYELPGNKPYSENPVFAVKNNHIMCSYIRQYIESAQKKFPEVPRLTEQQIKALDLFDHIATREDVMFNLKLTPGDLILINNNKVLHGRAAYEDEESKSRYRHLIRIWLRNEGIDSLPHFFGHLNP